MKVNHDNSFKPARGGYGEPIGKYPEYISPSNEKEEGQKTTNKEKPSE